MSQGSVLALWSHGVAQAPPRGFQDSVKLLGEGETPASFREWRGPVNILSWKHLEQVMGRDYRFEFKHCGKNICVTSADLSTLRPGDWIQVGTALLVTAQNGVTCSKPCRLEPGETAPCVLAENWILAEVVRGGMVHTDDPLLAVPA